MSASRHVRALLLFLLLAILLGGIAYPLAEAGLGTLLHAPPYPQPTAPSPTPPPANNSTANATPATSAPIGSPGTTTGASVIRSDGADRARGMEDERLLYERTLGTPGALAVQLSAGSLRSPSADGGT